jgi:hypothetical protein
MRTLLASAVALGAFTSAAFAEPLVLSDAQMDTLAAGQITQSNTSEVNVMQINYAYVSTTGDASVNLSNSASVSQSQGNSSTIAPPAE